MLNIYTADEVAKMADVLVNELHEGPPLNVLSPEIFVVQNYGMARWLSLYIAEKEGIAANLQFKFPAEIFWSMVRVMDPSIPETLPSERGPLAWAVMHILQTDTDASLSVLHQYSNEEDTQKQEARQWQLAQRIADIFDQYLTYRPGMMLMWEQGALVNPNSATEQWQAVLWQKVIQHWQQAASKKWQHRAALQKKLLKVIADESINKEDLPERITVFGVSSMPPVYLEMLAKISSLIDVSIYTVAGEMDKNQPLVKSFGESGEAFRLLINNFAQKSEAKFMNIASKKGTSDETLLKHFQQNLWGNKPVPAALAQDETIQVHSCHSIRRETEVLHNQILAMLDHDETLNPSDILVMAPDLQAYMSEIEGVFSTGEEGVPFIPYHFSEHAVQLNPVYQSFMKLMELVQSRFPITEVLDFLHYAPIKKQFSLNDEDLNTLESWIGDNQIRWGLNADHKTQFDVPESNRFTWQSGLNRMMLGYAMKAKEDDLFSGIYPYGEIERSENVALAGQFSSLMNALFTCHKDVQKAQTLKNWSKILTEWVTMFLGDDEEYFQQIQRIRDVISKLSEQAELAGYKEKVSFQVIRSWIIDMLETTSSGGGRSGKGVTFSSLIPMRNIPSRMICLLGMNDGDFPGAGNPSSFDLIKQDPKPGDRIHSRENRQIFLETLLAAKEYLYVSYIGKSNRQDTDFSPSVVVREWIDFMSDQYDISADDFITEHRLQAFSPAYFKKDDSGKLFSYSQKNKVIAERLEISQSKDFIFLEKPLPEPDPSFKQVTLDGLIQFFCNPAKFLLQNRLGIYLREEDVLNEDRESFSLGGLEGYKLGQKLLDRYLDDQLLSSYKELAFSKGTLPDNWPGEEAFDQKAKEVHKFGAQLSRQLTGKKLSALEVDISINDFTITGRLQHIYENEQVMYRFGKMRAKDLIELWIKHLVFQLVKPHGYTGISRLYTKDDKKGIALHQLAAISEPEPIIANLLELYWSGLKQKTPFFPNTSYTFSEEVIIKNKDEAKGINTASYKWQNDYAPYKMEGDDLYNKYIYNNINPLEDKYLNKRFKQLSISFWTPFFNVLNKEEEMA